MTARTVMFDVEHAAMAGSVLDSVGSGAGSAADAVGSDAGVTAGLVGTADSLMLSAGAGAAPPRHGCHTASATMPATTSSDTRTTTRRRRR